MRDWGAFDVDKQDWSETPRLLAWEQTEEKQQQRRGAHWVVITHERDAGALDQGGSGGDGRGF